MIDRSVISQASQNELSAIYHSLIIERMKLDKEFSVFLDESEMSETELDTPAWIDYRNKAAEYSNLSSLIQTTQYYIEQNGTR